MNENDKKSKHSIVLNLLVICIIILLMFIVVRCSLDSVDSDTLNPINDVKVFGLDVDKNAVVGLPEEEPSEVVEEKLATKAMEGMINISMNKNLKVEGSDVNLLLVNNEVNKYPQVVEIYLLDGSNVGERVYKSGLLPVGSRIESADLDVELDEGIHDAIAYFNAIDESSGVPVGQAAAKVTINVM